MSDKDYVLGVDTGKHLAGALLRHEDGMGAELEGMHYQHEEAFKRGDVRPAAKALGQMCIDRGASIGDVTFAVELPSHRYFGRGNSSSLLKAFWQGHHLMRFLSGQVEKVIAVPADQWNQQRDDKQKKMIFKQDFAPQYKELPYYQEKHGSRSNNHERDAALFAQFIIDRIRKGLPMRFD
jgi:hypothetical protein